MLSSATPTLLLSESHCALFSCKLLYSLVDIITPNAIEVKQLVGFRVEDPETAAQAAHLLRQRGGNTVVIKLGAQGAFCATTDGIFLSRRSLLMR